MKTGVTFSKNTLVDSGLRRELSRTFSFQPQYRPLRSVIHGWLGSTRSPISISDCTPVTRDLHARLKGEIDTASALLRAGYDEQSHFTANDEAYNRLRQLGALLHRHCCLRPSKAPCTPCPAPFHSSWLRMILNCPGNYSMRATTFWH
jgi:hypothetical protein